jgi:FkbM family methyltransferase
VLERLRAGPVDVERLGLKLRLHYYGTHVCDKKLLLHAQGYDREEIDLLARENGGCFRFVDVGAHTGFYSLAVKSMHPGARIVAFEPHPIHCNRLSYNVRTNALEHFTVRGVAVAAKNGVRPYYIDRESLIGKGASFEVPAVTLHDGLRAERLDGIDALKLDIEGYEDRVLFPFFETAPLSMWPRTIIIEHTLRHWWKNDCLRLCASIGYRPVFSGRFNTVLNRNVD